MKDIIIVIWIHWFADFILQTDKMAKNKSKSNLWLLTHVSVYTIPLMYFGFKYAIINGAAHFVVDWISSRCSSYFWKKQDAHNFFVVIRLDQAIHMTTLILTLNLWSKHG